LIEYFDRMIDRMEEEEENQRTINPDTCKWICVEYLTDLCVRYGLKYLYLWIHNHKKRTMKQ
jgi:hypothetical protein